VTMVLVFQVSTTPKCRIFFHEPICLVPYYGKNG
jgi:hypothetical protein